VLKVVESVVRWWKAFAHGLGRFQTVLILSLVYFLVVPPFSLIRFWDPLRRRHGDGRSWWEPMEPVDTTPEEAARRF